MRRSTFLVVFRSSSKSKLIAPPPDRLKVDSGIAVAGAVEPDADLIAYGKRIAEAVGLTSPMIDAARWDSLARNPRSPPRWP